MSDDPLCDLLKLTANIRARRLYFNLIRATVDLWLVLINEECRNFISGTARKHSSVNMSVIILSQNDALLALTVNRPGALMKSLDISVAYLSRSGSALAR